MHQDIRGLSTLYEEERLVIWLSIGALSFGMEGNNQLRFSPSSPGVAALNSVGYSLMILNICWYIYSVSEYAQLCL